MSGFVDKLGLKGTADENIYFAKKDLELIEALRKKRLSKLAKCDGGEPQRAKDFEKRFKSIAGKNKRKPRRLTRAIHALLDEIKEACERRR